MRPLTVKLLLVLLATAGAAWWFHTHEKRSYSEYVGYSGEATYNDFFAAEQLLQQLDIEADTKATLTPTLWLPPTSDTIISRVSSGISAGGELETLLGWVNNGGHLVILPSYRFGESLPEFYNTLGAEFIEVENEHLDEADDEENETDANSDEEADEEGLDEDEIFAMPVSSDYGIEYDLYLRYAYYRIELLAEDGFDTTLWDEKGIAAARRTWGSGYITVITAGAIFGNNQLGEVDHARFFLDAVAGYLEPGKVWFVLDASFPSFLELIWEHGYLVVMAAAVALLLWLAAILPRFGPPIEPRIASRRSILEHIAAAGHFAWKNRGTAELARSSAKALVHEVDRKNPGFSRRSPEDQARYLAKRSGVPAQDILDAMLAREETRHREFTQNTQLLQRVRKKL